MQSSHISIPVTAVKFAVLSMLRQRCTVCVQLARTGRILCRSAARNSSSYSLQDVQATVTKFDPSAPAEDAQERIRAGKSLQYGTAAPEGMSKRAAFKHIHVDNKLLAYLDEQDLGMAKKKIVSRRRRGQIERGFADAHTAANNTTIDAGI